MRTEVTKRIFDIIGEPGLQDFRNARWYPVAVEINKRTLRVPVMNHKSVRYFLVTDLDLQTLTDQEITEIFELIIRRQYIQM